MGRENNSFTVFFPSWYKKYKKHQIYIHDVKAPTDIFILLWYCSTANNMISFFLSLLWKLTKLARPHTSICDRHFSLLKFVSLRWVWIKVLRQHQSLCEAQRIVKGSFLLAPPELRGCHWFWKTSFFDFGALCIRNSCDALICAVKGKRNMPKEGWETDTGQLLILDKKSNIQRFDCWFS